MADVGIVETILNAVPEPMIYISERGNIDASNIAARALWGDWIAGRSHDTVLRQPDILKNIETARSGGADIDTHFHMTDQFGGAQFRVRIVPFTQPDVGPRALLLHFTNITQLHEIEKMRRNFIANVSHELHTPLTAILGFIETLRGSARNDPQAQVRFLSIMHDEAQRMNRLVSDLLSLSRVEEQERLRPSQRVDVGAVLMDVVAALRPTAEDHGNSVQIEMHPTDANTSSDDARYKVMGDRDQLMQVFFNLVENAMKYGGPDKPIILRIGRGDGANTQKGSLIRIDVIDQGEGIDQQHVPRLTERFYRIDTHRSRTMGGTGLGLAIVKHIVNRHRGALEIHSVRGKGSTFSVLLPAA